MKQMNEQALDYLVLRLRETESSLENFKESNRFWSTLARKCFLEKEGGDQLLREKISDALKIGICVLD